MARNAHALALVPWATDAAAIIRTLDEEGLDPAVGWPVAYSVDRFPPLGVFNFWWRALSAGIVEVGQRGILEWHGDQAYLHPCFVTGSDGRLYGSVQASGGDLAAVDPVGDAQGTFWRPLVQSASGLLTFADGPGVNAGALTDQAISPARLRSGLFNASPAAGWRASASIFGLARFGTQSEIDAGSAVRVVTGETLQEALRNLPAPDAVRSASTTQEGIARRATQAEADGGIAVNPFMTPVLVKRRIDAATPNASKTRRGLIEVASQAEADTGTDDERAMTAALVKRRIEALGVDGKISAAITALLASAAFRTAVEGIAQTGGATVLRNGFGLADSYRTFIATGIQPPNSSARIRITASLIYVTNVSGRHPTVRFRRSINGGASTVLQTFTAAGGAGTSQLRYVRTTVDVPNTSHFVVYSLEAREPLAVDNAMSAGTTLSAVLI